MWKNLAIKGEEAALKGNLRELYDITRKLTGKWKQSNRPIRDAKAGVGKLFMVEGRRACRGPDWYKSHKSTHSI